MRGGKLNEPSSSRVLAKAEKAKKSCPIAEHDAFGEATEKEKHCLTASA
jgi:hypothetical protein